MRWTARVCGHGQNVMTDCSYSCVVRDCALSAANSRSRTGSCRGRVPLLMHGCCAPTSRLISGRRILTKLRGKACPVLNVMGNTLAPLSNANAAGGFASGLLTGMRKLFEYGPCQCHNLRRDGMCPRIAEAEFRGSFFCGDFRWSFNRCAQRITKRISILAVGVVDAPELSVRLLSSARAHTDSSA